MKQLSVNFSKFTIIAVFAAALNVVFVWLLIDVMCFRTVFATTLVVSLIILLKFYAYIYIGLIKRQFFKYSFIQSFSALLNILFTWLLIDVIGIPTIIATILVVGSLFFGRLLLFKITKLLVD